jgi:hypothetical protein
MDKIKLITDRYDKAYSNQKNKLHIFNAIDDVLNQQTKDYTHNSKLGSPYGWAAVEMVTPRIVAKNPAINYEAREENDQDKAQNATDLFKYWAQKAGLFNLLTSWDKVANQYGTSILKGTWKTDKRAVTRFVYQDGQPLINPETEEYETYEEEVTTYDDPYFELVNNNYLFFNPGATDPKNCVWLIHKYWKVLDDLKAENKLTGIYKNLSQVQSLKEKDLSTEDKHRHEATGNNVEESDDTVDMVEILEMWDRTTGRQTMLANGSTIIMDRKFPYWHGMMPFIKLNDSIVPFEWYGKGEVEPILKDLYVIDVLTNARTDDLTGGRKKWVIRNNSNVDEAELYEPDLPLHIDNIDDAKLESLPDTTSNNVEEIARREASIQNTLGIADYSPAANSNADNTATGMTIKSEQLNARFAHKTQLFEESLKELGDMVLSLYQQFLTTEKSIRILGEKGASWVTLSPQDIAGEFDCIPEAGSTQSVDKNAEKQEYANAYVMMKDNPYFDQGAVNQKLAEKFFPKDYDTVMQDPEKVKTEQLQELLQTPQVQQLISDTAQGQVDQMTQGVTEQQDTQDAELQNKLLDHELEMEKIQAKKM